MDGRGRGMVQRFVDELAVLDDEREPSAVAPGGLSTYVAEAMSAPAVPDVEVLTGRPVPVAELGELSPFEAHSGLVWP